VRCTTTHLKLSFIANPPNKSGGHFCFKIAFLQQRILNILIPHQEWVIFPLQPRHGEVDGEKSRQMGFLRACERPRDLIKEYTPSKPSQSENRLPRSSRSHGIAVYGDIYRSTASHIRLRQESDPKSRSLENPIKISQVPSHHVPQELHLSPSNSSNNSQKSFAQAKAALHFQLPPLASSCTLKGTYSVF
jgi:hypothetical protein